MPSVSELRRKIRGIKSTQQITRAMKMIAGVRMARTQLRVAPARAYAKEFGRCLQELLGGVPLHEFPADLQRLMRPGGTGALTGLLVVTGDRGLCGAFNNNVLRAATDFLKQHPEDVVRVFVVGRKAQDFFRRTNRKASREYTGLAAKLDWETARTVAREILESYRAMGLSRLECLTNEMVSTIRQRVTRIRLLPMLEDERPGPKDPQAASIYLPGRTGLAEAVFEQAFTAQIYSILVESAAAEHAARLSAMENASKNAQKLIEQFTLEMNKARQAGITRELAEIVSTSEVIK